MPHGTRKITTCSKGGTRKLRGGFPSFSLKSLTSKASGLAGKVGDLKTIVGKKIDEHLDKNPELKSKIGQAQEFTKGAVSTVTGMATKHAQDIKTHLGVAHAAAKKMAGAATVAAANTAKKAAIAALKLAISKYEKFFPGDTQTLNKMQALLEQHEALKPKGEQGMEMKTTTRMGGKKKRGHKKRHATKKRRHKKRHATKKRGHKKRGHKKRRGSRKRRGGAPCPCTNA